MGRSVPSKFMQIMTEAENTALPPPQPYSPTDWSDLPCTPKCERWRPSLRTAGERSDGGTLFWWCIPLRDGLLVSAIPTIGEQTNFSIMSARSSPDLYDLKDGAIRQTLKGQFLIIGLRDFFLLMVAPECRDRRPFRANHNPVLVYYSAGCHWKQSAVQLHPSVRQ